MTRREETVWYYKFKEMMSGDLAKLGERIDKLEQKMERFEATSHRAFSSAGNAAKGFSFQNSKMFKGLESEIPMLGRFGEMLSNPYVIAGAALVGFGAIVVKSIAAAEEYNNQFLEIKNLNLDKTKAQLDKLNQTTLNTSLLKGIDPTEMAKAVGDIQGGTGKFGNEVVKMAGRIGEFSMATKTNFDAMTGGVVKAMNAYKFGTGEIDKFLVSNAKAVAVGIATFDEMAKVQTEFAGAATGAGQTYDVANKFFGAFTKVSKNVDIAATQTKTAFQGLADPKVQKGLKEYGVNVFDTSGKMKDATKIVEDLNVKIGSMSDRKFSQFMGDVGGPEGMRELLNMIKGQGDELIRTFKEFDDTTFNIGDAIKNAKGDFKTMKAIVGNQLTNIQVQLGQLFIGPLARGLDFVSQKLATATDLFSGITKEGSGLMGIFNDLKPVATALLDIFTLQYKVSWEINKAFREFAEQSELVKDLAWAIGKAFEGVGWVVRKMFEGIKWWLDATIMGPLARLERLYLKVTFQEGKVDARNREQSLQDKALSVLGQENYDKLSDPEVLKALGGKFNVKGRADVGRLIAQGRGMELYNALNTMGAGGIMNTDAAGTTLGGSKLDDNVKAITDGGKSPRNIYVTIDKLVENINNHVTDVKTGMKNAEQIILEGLVKTVRDAEMVVGGTSN